MTAEQPNPEHLIDRLANFQATFPAVVRCFLRVDINYKPDPDSWSVLEIVCHMADEEEEDFRLRVLSTLKDPEADWEPIDPLGWVSSRDYKSQDLDEQLNRWIEQRSKSVQLLRDLNDPDWTRIKQHPQFGPMSAIGLLGAWCAHDALHMRQLAKRLHQRAIHDTENDPATRYAGDW